MRNLKVVSQSKRGFTLVEMVLGISLSVILLASFYSVLNSSIIVSKKSNSKDDVLLNGRYAILYIKEEIKRCDKIIETARFKRLDDKYPNNIGFVFLEFDEKEDNYNYSTYYLKGNKLIRIACNETGVKYPNTEHFSGHNTLCVGVEKIEKFSYNPIKNIMEIDISFKDEDESKNFKTNVFLNCPMDLTCGGEDE